MGSKELIDSLYAEAERQVAGIRADARAGVDLIKAQSMENLRARKKEYEDALAAESKKQAGTVLREAREKARGIKLEAGRLHSERLYQMALSLLPRLRERGYEDVFAGLKEELPSHEWQVVRAGPPDAEIARAHFPVAELILDSAITGGIEVQSEQGKIKIINTFEKRLERLWPAILPLIMGDINKEIGRREIPDRESGDGRIP